MTSPRTETEELPLTIPSTSDTRPPAHRMSLRRLATFGGIVSGILLIVNAVVCATWSHFFSLPGWLAWQLVPGMLPVAFVATTFIGFRYSNPFIRFVYAVSAAWLGVLNYAFFAAALCWIMAGIAWAARWPLPLSAVATLFFGAAMLVAIYGLFNASWLQVTRVTVRLPNLPKAWQGHTALLVTDLHLGHLSGPAFLRRVIHRIRGLQPDAVFISGDLFDGTTVELDRLVAPWNNFSAPRGVYYVTGNHDEFADRRIYLDAVRRTGIRVLNNEVVSVDGLQIVGVHDSESGEADVLRHVLSGMDLDRQKPSILLAHEPACLAVAEEAGISLQLSGHTHQGQMWPWTYSVKRIYGRFAYGLQQLGKMQVYTSSGAGTWGPPLRVGTKSEIVLIRLEAS